MRENKPETLKLSNIFIIDGQRDLLSFRTSLYFIHLVSDNLLHPKSWSFLQELWKFLQSSEYGQRSHLQERHDAAGNHSNRPHTPHPARALLAPPVDE